MSKAQNIAVAGATFVVALGVGLVLQHGDALTERFARDGSDLDAALSTGPDLIVRAGLPIWAFLTPGPDAGQPQADTGLRPGPPPTARKAPPVELATAARIEPTDGERSVRIADPGDRGTPEGTLSRERSGVVDPDVYPASCTADLTAVPQPLAMVQITLTAPCLPQTVVTIRHDDLAFQGITDSAGTFAATVPALSDEATFVAQVAQGPRVAATVSVPDLPQVDRTALLWHGAAGVQLHAREFGAAYFGAGHVWADAPGQMEAALAGAGGLLTRLGRGDIGIGLMAEVYTFPTGTVRRGGGIALSVEAEVTARNCGRAIEARSIQVRSDAGVEAVDLAMTLPGCDARGEFLVLKNMAQDLTLAAR